ncbi:L,D-transpeptidase-like protein [Scopulibacillus darangshiensis]|uniref:L,D-transpeptidase-like protein n=1 Tax=Scopulibacillus darangshiensis TaxID=442528 RepID=A0A4R2P9T8_9BACL|nr:L,D-transpeptidase [Scopulibacillus darangshiensis]TCP31809.1 L,D-transpeptidase-like protein [Scopulibacillus darangshiensis]
MLLSKITLSFTALLMWLSPVWPLGENPVPGSPFIIVNKARHELVFINDNDIVMKVPVATGKTKELTPEGLFTVIVKAKEPYYRKKNIPGGDPDNPLGSRWIGFDARGTNGRIYGVHGNNNPDSIGKDVSAGCIRMQEEAIQRLFDLVPAGTKILIVDSDQSFQTLGRQYNALDGHSHLLIPEH